MLLNKLLIIPLIILFSCIPLLHADSTDLSGALSLDTKTRWHKTRFSPDNSFLALLNKKGKFAVINVATGKLVEGTGARKISYFDFSPDSRELWLIDKKGNLDRRDPRTAEKLDGKTHDGKAITWRLDTGNSGIEMVSYALFHFYLKTIKGDQSWTDVKGQPVLNAEGKLLHDGQSIVLAQSADKVHIWQPCDNTAAFKPEQRSPANSITGLACNNRCVITAHDKQDQAAYLWPISKAPKPYSLDGRVFLDHTRVGEPVITTDKTGSKIAYLRGQTLGIYHLTTDGFKKSSATTNVNALKMARFSSNGDYLIAKTGNGEHLKIYHGDTLKPVALPENIDRNQSFAIIGPSADSLVVPGENENAILITPGDISSQKRIAESLVDSEIRYSPSGKWITIKSINKGITVIDAMTAEIKHKFSADQAISRVLFSSNDQLMAVIDRHGKITIAHPDKAF